MAAARIVGALLAAGRGSRFGGNKLEARLGRMMIGEKAARVLASLNPDRLVAICGADAPVLDQALHKLGFLRILNTDPDAGLSQSIRLAAQQAMAVDADGLLVCLADMPFVTLSHLKAMLCAFGEAGHGLPVASRAGDQLSPPVLFPRSSFPDLMALSGDRGAQGLLKKAIPIDVSGGVLVDIDTRDDLAEAGAREAPTRS